MSRAQIDSAWKIWSSIFEFLSHFLPAERGVDPEMSRDPLRECFADSRLEGRKRFSRNAVGSHKSSQDRFSPGASFVKRALTQTCAWGVGTNIPMSEIDQFGLRGGCVGIYAQFWPCMQTKLCDRTVKRLELGFATKVRIRYHFKKWKSPFWS